MKVSLPGQLELSCPDCGLQFSGAPALLVELPHLSCPRCQAVHPAYFWLSPMLRQRISAGVRSRIYFAAHKLNTRDGGGEAG